MLTLLRAKQLVLLLQDGFRELASSAAAKDLIFTLKQEVQQLKETVAELNSPEINNLVEKLGKLLTIVPPDRELNSPIYTQESVQIILEVLRVTAGYLDEKSSLININFPELTVVLDELYQQKSEEVKLLTATPSVSTEVQIEPVKVPREKPIQSEEPQIVRVEIDAQVERIITDKISKITQELSDKLHIPDSLIAVESIKQIATDLAKSVEEIKDIKQNLNNPETDLRKEKILSDIKNNQHLIIHLNGKLLALPYQKVEKVQKLALSDLRLVGNNILANIEGNEIAMYDLAGLFGAGSEDENTEKETFLVAICPTNNGNIGLLFDKVHGFENLETAQFQSIIGKIKGIAGIAAIRTKNQNGEEPEQYQPVFILEPTEINSISQPD